MDKHDKLIIGIGIAGIVLFFLLHKHAAVATPANGSDTIPDYVPSYLTYNIFSPPRNDLELPPQAIPQTKTCSACSMFPDIIPANGINPSLFYNIPY